MSSDNSTFNFGWSPDYLDPPVLQESKCAENDSSFSYFTQENKLTSFLGTGHNSLQRNPLKEINIPFYEDSHKLSACNYSPWNTEKTDGELLFSSRNGLNEKCSNFSRCSFQKESMPPSCTSNFQCNVPPNSLSSVQALNLQCCEQTSRNPIDVSKQYVKRENKDLATLMQELEISNLGRSLSAPCRNFRFQDIDRTATGCVFCKNNGYHSTFCRSHVLKDENGLCTCPVLRAYVCPLCGNSGSYAHTLKYCPLNTVTRGDPISVGLPPGKVSNWREVAFRLSGSF